MPPPCVKNPYLDTDPCIDDHAYGGRQCNSAGFSPSIGGDVFHVTGLIFMKLSHLLNSQKNWSWELQCCVQSSDQERWVLVCSEVEHQTIA